LGANVETGIEASVEPGLGG